jgi:hypothetical protein
MVISVPWYWAVFHRCEFRPRFAVHQRRVHRRAGGQRCPHQNGYGSPVHKQVYIYGVLNPGPRVLEGNLGAAWGVGGWLMTWFYEKIGPATAQRLRDRVANELTNTFASHYTSEISLADALSPKIIAAYSRRATGEKFLMCPSGAKS